MGSQGAVCRLGQLRALGAVAVVMVCACVEGWVSMRVTDFCAVDLWVVLAGPLQVKVCAHLEVFVREQVMDFCEGAPFVGLVAAR